MRHGAALLLALALALLAAPPARAQATDIEGYLLLLREAHAAAERRDRIGLEQVAPALLAVRRVALPGGEAPADNRWLAEALDTPDPDLPTIAARLGALIEALTYPSGPPAADAEARLRAILAAPPFTRPELPRAPGWLDRLFEWLLERIASVLSPVGRAAAENGGGLSWAIAALGLLIVAAVTTIWLRGLRRAIAPPAHMRDDPEAGLGPGEAARQAGDLARAGDYRRAARLLYLSALLWLDESGRLRYERDLTNREHLDRLEGSPALREALRPVVETFDRVWYGEAPLDADGFAAYQRQVEALREL